MTRWRWQHLFLFSFLEGPSRWRGIIWLVLRSAKKRKEALIAIAAETGFNFWAVQDEDLLLRVKTLFLFNRGHGRKMRNVMTTETDDVQLSIFDYQYTTGGDESWQTHRQTVVALESDMQGIDFEKHPEFSGSFVLTGNDEQAVRSFFDEKLLDLFVQHKGTCVESAPGVFIYFRNGRRKPE